MLLDVSLWREPVQPGMARRASRAVDPGRHDQVHSEAQLAGRREPAQVRATAGHAPRLRVALPANVSSSGAGVHRMARALHGVDERQPREHRLARPQHELHLGLPRQETRSPPDGLERRQGWHATSRDAVRAAEQAGKEGRGSESARTVSSAPQASGRAGFTVIETTGRCSRPTGARRLAPSRQHEFASKAARAGRCTAPSTSSFARSSESTIAWLISSSVTVTTSSRRLLTMDSVSSPGLLTAIPSAIVKPCDTATGERSARRGLHADDAQARRLQRLRRDRDARR